MNYTDSLSLANHLLSYVLQFKTLLLKINTKVDLTKLGGLLGKEIHSLQDDLNDNESDEENVNDKKNIKKSKGDRETKGEKETKSERETRKRKSLQAAQKAREEMLALGEEDVPDVEEIERSMVTSTGKPISELNEQEKWIELAKTIQDIQLEIDDDSDAMMRDMVSIYL